MISVITPSFNQSDWLRLAVASVADQEGIEHEHIVQDALSTDGTRDWLANDSRVQASFEKDAGMYDAINRGLRRTTGEICAYLNCDEQYLPGALRTIENAFQQDPTADLIFAGSIVVDAQGAYICSRPALQPSFQQLAAGNMYNLTSSIFFRARVFREHDLFFDPNYRVIGDLEWMLRVVEAGLRIITVPAFTSVFADLGTNLALSPSSAAEKRKLRKRRPGIPLGVAKILHRLQRWRAGHYRLPPFDYAIYTAAQPDHRKSLHVQKPTGVWHNRL